MEKEKNMLNVLLLLTVIGFGIVATGVILHSGHIAIIGVEVTILAICAPLILMIFKY